MESKEVSIEQIHHSTKQIIKLLNDINVPLSTGINFTIHWEFIIQALAQWRELKKAEDKRAFVARLNELEESDLNDDENPFIKKIK